MHRKLLLLNGLAVLGVVLNHATGWGFTAMFWWADRYRAVAAPNFDQVGSASYYALRFIEQAVAFTVPAFLFVSGFFIAFALGRAKEGERWRTVGSRIKMLVIPYLIWSTLLLAAGFIQGERYSAAELVRAYLFGRAAAPYYYIPLLVQLLLLAPFLVAAAKSRWRALLVGAAVLQLLTQGLYYLRVLGSGDPGLRAVGMLAPSWFFTSKLFWFVLGIVICLHLAEFKGLLARTRRAWPAALVIFLALGMVESEALLRASGEDWIPYYDTALDSLYALAFIMSFLAYDKLVLPQSERLGELGTKSYGVYLIHAPAQEYMARAVAVLIPALLAVQAIFQPLLWLAGLGAPLLLMWLVSRSPANRYYRYLFG
jgi:fucose 4-O-acetylase-like acetyltransferase